MKKETGTSTLMRRKLLITGCGRSGTKYTSLILRRLGLDIGHEQMGSDGVASWYLAVNSDQVPPFGDVATNCEFDHVFHQIRHPLSVIESVTTFTPESWDFICTHSSITIDEPLLLRCAKYWLYWNLEAEKHAEWHYKVEEFPQIFPSLCEKLNLNADQSAILTVSPDTNTRKYGWFFHAYQEICHRINFPTNQGFSRLLTVASKKIDRPSISWHTLQSLDDRLARAIWDKSRQYGYVN